MKDLDRTAIGLDAVWWARRGESPEEVSSRVELPRSATVVVVGAGLTGMSTAVRLAQQGIEPLVIEARRVGSGTSGRTNAKVSLLQGSLVQGIRRAAGAEAASAYVTANREGQAWLLELAQARGVEVQTHTAVTYAVTPSGERKVRDELSAVQAAGLDAQPLVEHDLPFAVRSAISLEDQAQVDPLALVRALREELESLGGRVVEGVRVTGLNWRRPWRLETEAGAVRCERVVLATQTPILDRTLDFARLTGERSYVLAYEADLSRVPHSMSLSLDKRTRSLRTAPATAAGESDLLLVGGNGHTVGARISTRACIDDLDQWAREYLEVGELRWAWSAQDYRAAGAMPRIGPVPGTDEALFVATGYNKWGLTNAPAAAHIITADIMGSPLPYAGAFRGNTSSIRGVADAAKHNARVAAHLAGDRARLALPKDIAHGEGRVTGNPLTPTAVAEVDRGRCAVSAVCTHLGGVLSWNDAEQTWDCPLHASRFTMEGAVIEGPATRPLGRREE
ncbi:FAD-dependent oxidoreductase [Nostocoides sp. F2B08]|uniref:FAD-dependent oxidoreductase n=1 Tax=Nostocoides sp. F2B08 TaxID=2653936 RepID=UPI00186B03A0|nr:FAD-dependent oxidoreductase [Tetrasphaera sp. F2B08]